MIRDSFGLANAIRTGAEAVLKLILDLISAYPYVIILVMLILILLSLSILIIAGYFLLKWVQKFISLHWAAS